MPKIRLTPGIILLFTPLVSASSDPGALTLPEAVLIAQQKSPELHRLEWVSQAASWKKLEALSGHLPQISLNSNYYLDAKYSNVNVALGGQPLAFPMAFPQTSLELTASLTLFDGFGTYNLYRAAILNADAAQLDYDHMKFQLGQKVEVKFYQALAAHELAQVADQNIITLEQHLNLVQVSEQAGTGTRVDVLRIQAQLEEARAERILADDNVVLAKRTLQEEMGISSDNTQEIAGVLPTPNAKLVSQDLKLDLAARPDFEAQTKRENAADRLTSAATGFWFPKISVFASEQYYSFNGTFNSLILASNGLQNAYGLGLRLSWNLFDGGYSIARKAQVDSMAQQAIETTRKLQLSSLNEFETWKRRFNYNTQLFNARQRSVEQSSESVRLAAISVKAGTKTHSEFLDAERDLFRARAGVINAQLAAAEALSNLALALGRSL